MYADRVTGSMQRAIDETYRRRRIQIAITRRTASSRSVFARRSKISVTPCARWRKRKPFTTPKACARSRATSWRG
ncbi:MAG TPA: hypothetical protein VGP33_16910 [Chloroflexota bacterium]|nr:hypothetical protein [Chloroflexota bacterium]